MTSSSRQRITERLRELLARRTPMSRNKRYELFQDELNRRALRLHRFISGLAAEISRLSRTGTITISRRTIGSPSPLTLEIVHRGLGYRRVVPLTDDELDLLLERAPVLHRVLDAAD